MKATLLSAVLILNSFPAFAQATLDDFTSKLVQTLKTGNEQTFAELIHPDSIQKSKTKNEAKHNKKIKLILKTSKLTNSSKFEIRFEEPSEFKNYNPIDNSVTAFGGYRAVFNKPLLKKLNLYITTNDNTSGAQLTSPHLIEFITKDNGRWYITWPTEFIKN